MYSYQSSERTARMHTEQGVDLSEEALNVAMRNARTLEVAERVEFVQSNLFAEVRNTVYDGI